MKKIFAMLSFLSFILYALVDFGKNVLETYFHIQLMTGNISGFTSKDYFVDAGMCQTILIVLAVSCLVLAIAETWKDRMK